MTAVTMLLELLGVAAAIGVLYVVHLVGVELSGIKLK